MDWRKDRLLHERIVAMYGSDKGMWLRNIGLNGSTIKAVHHAAPGAKALRAEVVVVAQYVTLHYVGQVKRKEGRRVVIEMVGRVIPRTKTRR